MVKGESESAMHDTQRDNDQRKRIIIRLKEVGQ
jgi:hypothetical protein